MSATLREQRDEFIAFHLARELDRDGATIAAAASRLRGAFAPELHAQLEESVALLEGRANPSDDLLAALLAETRRHGGSAAGSYVSYRAALDNQRSLFSGFLSGIWDVVVYALVMLVILTAIVSVYSVFVIPQFQRLFEAMDQPLPGFTLALLGNSWLILPLLLLLIVAVVVLLFAMRRWRHVVHRLAALGPRARFWPMLQAGVRAHDVSVLLRVIAILVDGKLSLEQAQQAATECFRAVSLDEETSRQLQAANRLERIRGELDRQIERHSRTAWAELLRCRNHWVLVARLIVYVLVGSFVVAMYLPIFKLGTVA